jgi:hypothetical protein
MRKPDGVTLTGGPSLMLLSDRTDDIDDVNADPSSAKSAASASGSTKSRSGAKSARSASTSGGSLRRKSKLPKASKKALAQKGQGQGDEGESEEDGDLPVHLDAEVDVGEQLGEGDKQDVLACSPGCAARRETGDDCPESRSDRATVDVGLNASSASSRSTTSVQSSSASSSSSSSTSSTLTALSASSRAMPSSTAESSLSARSGVHVIGTSKRSSPRKGTGVHARLAAPAAGRTARTVPAPSVGSAPPVSSRRIVACGRSTPVPFA